MSGTCLNCGETLGDRLDRPGTCPDCGESAAPGYYFHTVLGEFVPAWLGGDLADSIERGDLSTDPTAIRERIIERLGWTWTPGKANAALSWLRDARHLPGKAKGRR